MINNTELETNHKKPDSYIMLDFKHASRTYSSVVEHILLTFDSRSKIMERDCQLYLKTGTELHKRNIDKNAVAQFVNHNISKTDFNKDIFLKPLVVFHCFTGCDSKSYFAGNGKWSPCPW